jgi:hypothetical protein
MDISTASLEYLYGALKDLPTVVWGITRYLIMSSFHGFWLIQGIFATQPPELTSLWDQETRKESHLGWTLQVEIIVSLFLNPARYQRWAAWCAEFSIWLSEVLYGQVSLTPRGPACIPIKLIVVCRYTLMLVTVGHSTVWQSPHTCYDKSIHQPIDRCTPETTILCS